MFDFTIEGFSIEAKDMGGFGFNRFLARLNFCFGQLSNSDQARSPRHDIE